MANFKEFIERHAEGKPILGVVLSVHDDDKYRYDPDEPRTSNAPINTFMVWEEALAYIDYEFDEGFGSPDCHAYVAWTEDRVLFNTEYDGAISPMWAPRNPQDCKPEF